MIKLVSGDIFKARTEVIVNPVNCVGVMGAGLAYAFKVRYPYCYIIYREECAKKKLKVGTILPIMVSTNLPTTVVCFPTKVHWRDRSSLTYIKDGLIALRKYIVENNVKSISIPRIGCGLGGLDWNDVSRLIFETLGNIDTCDIVIYEQ